MPYKNLKKQQAYARKYRRKNIKKLRTRARLWAQEHYDPKKKRIIARRFRQRNRKKLLIRWGCHCFICNGTKRLCVHHDHSLQKKLKCCHSANGCDQCRVATLCFAHNIAVDRLNCGDNKKLLRKLKQIWRRTHGKNK